jgi:hypothetical protein
MNKGLPPGIRKILSGHPRLPRNVSLSDTTPNFSALLTTFFSMLLSRICIFLHHYPFHAAHSHVELDFRYVFTLKLC